MRTGRVIAAGRVRAALAVVSLAVVVAGVPACGGGNGDPLAGDAADPAPSDVPADEGAGLSPAPSSTPPSSSSAPPEPSPPPPAAPVIDDESSADVTDADAPLRRLERRLVTRVIDALDHDSWICIGESSRIEYRLVSVGGTRRGAELDGAGRITAAVFGWAAIGADTLLLDYADVGRQVELGAILFADDDAFRTNDAAKGPLECRRQRYVGGRPTRDVAVAVAGDVDRDVEAAAALVARIETRRDDDGAFDHWRCEATEERATGYVFAAAGVLGPEPRAVVFDAATRVPVDAVTLEGGRAFRWLATDGTSLLLVPLDADVATAVERPETTSLDAIVFPVDDVFTARRPDGALLQCLRGGDR